MLLRDAAPRIKPIGFEPAEFRAALAKRNRLACDVTQTGMPLAGDRFPQESAAFVPRAIAR